MDPTELPSNPDDAAGESASAADRTANEPEIRTEPVDRVSEADQSAITDAGPSEEAAPPVQATETATVASTDDVAQPDATGSESPPEGGAEGAGAADDAGHTDATHTVSGDLANTAGDPAAARDAVPGPDAPTRPSRVISSSGAPGTPAGPAALPVGKVPDQGAIPPPPGLGSAITAGATVPTLGEIRGLRSGQIIEGRVTQVDANEAVLGMDDGSVGVIGKRHLTANGQTVPTELLSVGDRVEAAVLVRDDPKGRLVLSRAWALKQRAWEVVEAAKSANKPLTGRVTGLVKGGLVVDVGTRAFLPASQIDLQHVDDLASFVGQDIEALVHEADRINDKVVLSRRNLLRQAQRAKANEVVSTLAPGQVHKGRVSLLTDFGAFVEIGGVRGLVHLSEISWSRVDRAADVLSPGDEIDVKVLAIKPGKKLSLSIRALSPDPLAGLEAGQVLSGIVTRLADFGAFVRVGEGAEGLVHVTELAEYRVHAPEEVVTPGDEVLVKVLRIDRKRRRLDLSVNQAVLS